MWNPILGKSWVMAVTKTQNYIFKEEEGLELDQDMHTNRQPVLGN